MKKLWVIALISLSGISLPFAYMPTRFEVVESANALVTYNITLISNRPVTEEVDLSLSSWEVKDDQFLFYAFNEDWVHLPASHLSILPGETQTLAIGVKVPTSSGERRFEVDFTSEMANASFRFSKAVPIYLVTEGTEKIGCQIVSFNIVHDKNFLRASYVIDNTGNVHLRPRIEVQFPGDAQWIRIQDDMPIYPYSRRRFETSVAWPDSVTQAQTAIVRLQYYDTQGRVQTIIEKAIVY